MNDQSIVKVVMAERLDTSRSQLDRLLDLDNGNVTLATLAKAAKAAGRSVRLGLFGSFRYGKLISFAQSHPAQPAIGSTSQHPMSN